MTNEQLAVLLRSYGSRLERELELLGEALPETLPRAKTIKPVYIGDHLFPVCDQRPEAWQEKEEQGDYIVLQGLWGLWQEIDEAVGKLEQNDAD